MLFEWDERKRNENIARRGVDFLRAALAFDDPDRLEIKDDRHDYGEDRRLTIGRVADEFYALVYTLRAMSVASSQRGSWAKMADDDTKRYSIDDIRRMNERGEFVATAEDAPTIELDETFWEKAKAVGRPKKRKASVHLRIDPDTIEFFRRQGRGHLTRMAEVLKAYADSKR